MRGAEWVGCGSRAEESPFVTATLEMQRQRDSER